MSTGIDLVLADHHRVDALFEMFDSTHDPGVVGQIIDALALHDQAEHAALYPLAQALLGDEDLLTRSMLAHSAVKTTIEHLRSLEGEALVTAVGVLQGLVQTHVTEEETNLLPALAAAATEAQLDGLGARFEQAKQRVG